MSFIGILYYIRHTIDITRVECISSIYRRTLILIFREALSAILVYMPDLLPADHPDFIPLPPIDMHVAGVGPDVIHVGCAWYIDRVGRIPHGMHGYVIPYNESFNTMTGLNELLRHLETTKPMFCPQPSFKITHISKCPELGSKGGFVQPDTPYLYAFKTYNDAGESRFVGNFDEETGEAWPISTLPEGAEPWAASYPNNPRRYPHKPDQFPYQ